MPSNKTWIKEETRKLNYMDGQVERNAQAWKNFSCKEKSETSCDLGRKLNNAEQHCPSKVMQTFSAECF